MAFDRSLPQLLAALVIAKPEHRCSRVVPPCVIDLWSLCSTKNSDSCGLRSRDCALRLDLRCTPTPLLHHGVGRVCLRLQLQTLCKAIALPRNLRLFFRLVYDGRPRSLVQSPLSHTDSHVLPPIRLEVEAAYIPKPTARQLSLSVCDAKPHASCVGSPSPGARTQMH